MSSGDAGGAGPETAEPAPPPVDEARQALFDVLATELGDAVVGSAIRSGDIWVRVRPDSWRRTAEVCRQSLDMDYFCYLSGIDWMPHTWPNPKVIVGEGDDGSEAQPEPEPEPSSEIVTGVAGGDTRFQVLARLYSTSRHIGITLKADLDAERPAVETWSPVYPGADWCERETWEMYGFVFEGHPNLVKMYLPGEFEGFPLRKDFPLLSREVKPWPGLVDVEPFPAGTDAGEEG